MKLTQLFTVLIMALVANSSFAELDDEREMIRSSFPRFEEVLTHLNNTLRYECKDCSYSVAKKRDGYYLSINSYNDNGAKKNTKLIPIWSLSSGNYIEIDDSGFRDSSSTIVDTHYEFSDLYKRRNKYDLMLLYGYPQWSQDVQQLLSNYTDLSAQDLEILARSKADEALSQLHPNMNGEKFSFAEDLKDLGYAKVPQKRKDEYYRLANEAMSYWEQIKVLDPNYKPLIIEEIGLKMANDYMHFYFMSLSVMEQDMANEFFRKTYYSPAREQYAKNMLDGCSENGILFTAGDNDTYPLWYVQKKYGYRQDVLVLNTSLLLAPWYIEMTRQNFKLKSLLNPESSEKLSKYGFYPDPKSAQAPFKQWLEKNISEPDSVYNDHYLIIPKGFILPYKGDYLKFDLHQNTFYANYIALLDIIANNPDRDVFSASPYQFYNFGLYSNFSPRGSVYELHTSKEESVDDSKSIDHLERILSNTGYSYFNGMDYGRSNDIAMICYNISYIQFNRQKQSDLLDEFMNELPFEEAIKFEDYSILESLLSLYETLKPHRALDYKNNLAPIALERIQNIHSINKDLDRDIHDMEEIFSIYSGQRVYSHQKNYKILSSIEKDVILSIQFKVEELLDTQIIKNRAWTEEKLRRLKEATEVLENE